MLIFVSGPVTGLPQDNRPAFEAAADALSAAGLRPALPHWAVPAGATWEAAMRKSVGLLLVCDGVALIDGWEASRGARLEERLARETGMDVRPLRGWLDGRGPRRGLCFMEGERK